MSSTCVILLTKCQTNRQMLRQMVTITIPPRIMVMTMPLCLLLTKQKPKKQEHWETWLSASLCALWEQSWWRHSPQWSDTQSNETFCNTSKVRHYEVFSEAIMKSVNNTRVTAGDCAFSSATHVHWTAFLLNWCHPRLYKMKPYLLNQHGLPIHFCLLLMHRALSSPGAIQMPM